MRRERAGVAQVVSDARDAWTIPIGGRARVELAWPSGTNGTVETAVALELAPDAPRSGRVRAALSVAGQEEPFWSVELDLAELARAEGAARWRPVQHELGALDGSLALELAAEWVGPAPAGAERVRAAFELPRAARGIPRPPEGAPNVLVITVDTLRADRLSCQGYARATTPHVDALAARGARFANAYSSAPWTLPAYGSLLTGLLPGEHRAGVVTERAARFGTDESASALTTERLRADVPTFAQRFAEAGWATALLHNNPYLSRETGLERGFQRYVAYGSNAANGVDLALAWIDQAHAGPWFLVLHLMDPHFPYAPPAPYDERFAGRSIESLSSWPPDLAALRRGRPDDELARLSSDLYDGEIAFTDAEIGRLLAGLAERGLEPGTIVALHSDHGEEFWEHGGCDHGHAQHEELLRVPLLVSWPGRVPACVVEPRVRAHDLLPTLLALSGIAPRAGIDGLDLAPLWQGPGAPRGVIAEAVHSGAHEIKAALAGSEKLVVSGASGLALYDLARDPAEREDRAALDPARARELRARLEEHHQRSLAAAARAQALQLDPRLRAELERLGYAGAVLPR
jgi:arylsulfatase A-like enzyme